MEIKIKEGLYRGAPKSELDIDNDIPTILTVVNSSIYHNYLIRSSQSMDMALNTGGFS